MPRTRAVDANHGVMTDHSIPAATPKAEALPPAGTLTPFPWTGGDRALGLAYAEPGDKRARAYLLRATPRDWPVRLRFAAVEPDAAKESRILLHRYLELSPVSRKARTRLAEIGNRSRPVKRAGTRPACRT